MKYFYFTFLFLFTLIFNSVYGQSFIDLQTCDCPQVDYASSVPANNQNYWDNTGILAAANPITDTSNPTVYSIKGNNSQYHYVTYILPNPISPTAGETFSLNFYAPSAGSLNTGTGRVIVKFWVSTLGINGEKRQYVVDKTGGIWETIAGDIDDAQGATQSFDRVTIFPHYTSAEAGTFDPLYVDDFVISNNQSYEVISLDTDNDWIDYVDSSASNYASQTTLGMTLEEGIDNLADACFNSGSSKVTKLTRGSLVQSRVSYTFNSPIDKDNAVFKMRLFPVSGTAQVYGVLRTNADSNTDQLVTAAPSYTSGEWHDITFDFSSSTGGATGSVYNALNIRVDWNLAGTTENNEYLIDALQGPAEVTTLSTINIQQPLGIALQLNPVSEYLSLNDEVDKVQVINVLGKSILNFDFNASQYDVSSLSKGIYFAKVSKANQSRVLKFVKK